MIRFQPPAPTAPGSRDPYRAFVEAKAPKAQETGFEIPAEAVNPAMKPHAAALTRWGVRGGRRAYFTAFGLHKTTIQLETGRLILAEAAKLGHAPRGLIVLPLGVRQEFRRDAVEVLGWETPPPFIRTTAEAPDTGLCLTNYESVREGKIDPAHFTWASLDEASCLRSYGSKTFQTFLPLFDRTPYRHVATATPSPNRFKELIHYAGFLGVMDTGQALTRFFQRNSEKAGDLTLYPHKEREFWLWIHSWACFIQKPSDLCGCPCHRESSSSAAASAGSKSTGGFLEPSGTGPGDAGATAAASVSRDHSTCLPAKSSAVAASGRGTGSREQPPIERGEECSTGSSETPATTAIEEFSSATDGASSSASTTTWDSPRQAGHSSGSTITGAMNPETAAGPAERNKQETPVEPSTLSMTADGSLSPLGLRNSDFTIRSSTAATARDGHPSACSATDCASCRTLDEGYELPELEVRWHEVQTDLAAAEAERDGQGRLFRSAALGLQEAARERRDSLPARIAKAVEIRQAEPEENFILWHDLEAERHALEAALGAVRYDAWEEFRDGNPRAIELYERHYSAYQYPDGRERALLCGPGQKTVLLTRERDALFAWRKFIDKSGQEGVNAAVFRNEGSRLSSDLIKEAMAIAWLRWPGERLYTYVNAKKTAARRSKRSDPGECFIRAGWRRCGKTAGGLDVLEVLPGAEIPALCPRQGLVSVYGTQDLDAREQAIIDFSDGKIRDLAAKPVIAGSGCNFQRHCRRAVFVGVGFKFNDFIQAIHRIQRFGQAGRVVIDIVHAETEREVRRDLEAKWARDRELRETMSEIIRKYGLNHREMASELSRAAGVERIEASGRGWLVANNDCVAETRSMEADSVDLIVTSIPFSNHYEYTPNYCDFGHTDDDGHFFAQMDYLTAELIRVLKPGRVAAVHVKDRILFGAVTGMGRPTVNPFHAKTLFHLQSHGFAFLGMITVVTDVVRENNQTYRLGYTEMCKDGTKMGVGSPEYVLLFSKPQTDRSKGYADEPVKREKADYSLARWQVDAHAFWRSSGDRLLRPEELAAMPPDVLSKAFTRASLAQVYDYETHVRIGEALEARGALPSTFMALAPGSADPDVWHDVHRMLTLNGEQSRRGLENHICPLQFDIVDRLIERYSAPGELVFDPFGGLFTVPYRALKAGRRGRACELNAAYFADGVSHLEAMEREVSMPSLFDLLDAAGDAAPGREAA